VPDRTPPSLAMRSLRARPENEPARVPRKGRRPKFRLGNWTDFGLGFDRFMNEEQIAEIVDPIYREKVLRARRLSAGERIDTGIGLFEAALCLMRDGVRYQFPRADKMEVESILRKRLARLKQVHEHGLYSNEIE